MKGSLVALLSPVLVIFPLISSAQTMDQNGTSTSTDNYTNSSTNNSAADNKMNPMENKKEIHLIEVIEQIDQNEINAAEVVLNTTTNSDVKDFANSMKSDHEKNLKDAEDLTKKLNLTTTSSQTSELEKKGATQLNSLKTKQGKEFDNAYVEDMIKGHTEALNLLNRAVNRLANSNANSDFVDFVKDTQKMVSHHLDDAKKLQAKLQKS